MLLTFASTRGVIKAEYILRAAGVEVSAVPLASDTAARCGIALKVDEKELENIENLLKNIEYERKI